MRLLVLLLVATGAVGQLGGLRRAARRLFGEGQGQGQAGARGNAEEGGAAHVEKGFVATGEHSYEGDARNTFPRRLDETDGPASWACQAGEDPSSSCCGAVPAVLDVFTGTDCQQHFGLVALALGMSHSPIPGVSIPSAPSDIAAGLASFCPSVCAHAVAGVVDEYRSRPPMGRLCPMVHDGLWRLAMMCEKDTSTTGPSSTSTAYCLPTYVTIHQAFDEAHAPVTPASLDTMCASSCVRKLVAASVAQAATLNRAVPAGDSSTEAALVRYAAKRTSAMTRMLDMLCSRDPTDAQYCIVKSNLLARPDMSVGGTLLSPGVGGGSPISDTAGAACLAGALANPIRALTLPGSPVAAEYAERTTKRLLSNVKRNLQTGVAGGGSQDAPSPSLAAGPQPGDLLDSDDFITAMNPVKRHRWACSSCGRTLLYGLMDLAEIFGLDDPAGEGSPELSPDVIRQLLSRGCGVHVGSNRTCLDMLASSTPASQRYDPQLGLAMQGLSLCADFAQQALQAEEGGSDTPIPSSSQAPKCSQGCSYALEQARTAYGCCLPSILTMAAITGRGPFRNATAFARSAEAACGVTGLSRGFCRAALRRFVATRLSNIRYAWLAESGDRMAAFMEGWRKDLASSAGLDPGSLTIVRVLQDEGGGVIVIAAIVAVSERASVDSVATAQAVTGGGTVPLVNTVTAIASDPAYSPSDALQDVTTPIAVTDVTPMHAPAAEAIVESSSGTAAVSLGAARWVGLLAALLTATTALLT